MRQLRRRSTTARRARERLESTAERFDTIGDVRGRGLMLGVEFVDRAADWRGPGPHAPSGDLAESVQAECFDRGLIIELGGRKSATARFLPPLIVSAGQTDEIATIFEEAVTSIHEGRTRTREVST
ncbi:diaminobutyrate--pyruvate aminotransferase [Halalkalicoccus jeotgali B3]|uniref:Diaminobutyrate--pyruvate aminotransferase n=1 Tax=Halalkalicoccus jeotgali (strain DSM 18796 / CECT 7217 / JCM 14584 / KCTC 4019 / B3) TaxID=795797 RepID=D8JB88_HALJB|nr:aminotransferase class III-fold pyridoxal phosphate-dependent enzyme [Halalkalicoccus jeotgali]ADJ16541.1 diaminobutyrate--pyruvate aminotransferase (siderophore biosynthesis protein) [Halalkalicoccus jeotgali B3]ELY41364.1 diaminobutyrate--pyruvate aminotransferase [Halalkalicoccus jeotgali B3]